MCVPFCFPVEQLVTQHMSVKNELTNPRLRVTDWPRQSVTERFTKEMCF